MEKSGPYKGPFKIKKSSQDRYLFQREIEIEILEKFGPTPRCNYKRRGIKNAWRKFQTETIHRIYRPIHVDATGV